MLSNGSKYILVFIIIVSALRIASALTIGNNDLIYDEVSHISVSRSLVNGLGYGYVSAEFQDSFRPPLTPVIFSGFFLIFGSNIIVARMVSVVFGIASIILLFYMTKRFYGKKISIYSTIIFATLPTLWFFSSKALVESTLIFLTISFLHFLLLSKENNRYLLLVGIVLGLLFLDKYLAGIFTLIYLIYVILLKREFLKTKYFYLSFVMLMIVLSPWMLHNLFVYEHPLGAALSHFSSSGGFGTNLDLFYISTFFYQTSVFLPFFFIGLYFLYRKKNDDLHLFILFSIIFVVMLSLLDVKRIRYLMPILPIVSITSAYSFQWLGNLKNKFNMKQLTIILFILLIIANGFATYYGYENYPKSDRFIALKHGGIFIENNCMNKNVFSNVYPYVFWFTEKQNKNLGEFNNQENSCVLFDGFIAAPDERFELLDVVFEMGQVIVYFN